MGDCPGQGALAVERQQLREPARAGRGFSHLSELSGSLGAADEFAAADRLNKAKRMGGILH